MAKQYAHLIALTDPDHPQESTIHPRQCLLEFCGATPPNATHGVYVEDLDLTIQSNFQELVSFNWMVHVTNQIKLDQFNVKRKKKPSTKFIVIDRSKKLWQT